MILGSEDRVALVQAVGLSALKAFHAKGSCLLHIFSAGLWTRVS
jgi:hypothetical protein